MSQGLFFSPWCYSFRPLSGIYFEQKNSGVDDRILGTCGQMSVFKKVVVEQDRRFVRDRQRALT